MTSTARPARGTVPQAAQDDVATAALTLLTVVTALGMGRLFSNSSFMVPVLAAALVVHGSAWACRRLGIGGLLTFPISAGALLLAAAWTVLPGTTAGGIPWKGTLEAGIEALTEANQKFGQVVAPVEPEAGFVLAAALGVGLVALMADWAAFRVRSTWESVVPAFGLFVFTSLLGADRWQWWAISAQVVAMLGVICLHWARVRVNSTPWLGSRATTAGTTSAASSITPLLSGAAMLTALAVGAALFIGPRLPGADDPPLIGVRDESDTGPGKRTTISPLVDIRGRLTERSQREAFAVKTDAKAYWRLTALDTFNGQIWSSNDSYREAGRELDQVGPQSRNSDDIVQEYSINELASIWLPAAYQPVEIEGVEGVSYNAESGSVISKFPTSDGLNYTVRSRRPTFTPAELASGAALTPSSMQSHLELPPGISTRVHDLARRVVGAAGAETPFDRALALQNYLRGDDFAYDIDVNQGHGGEALENFLLETRRGYCEQFAGSYAVLARIVGLPSRVAVGFTPGDFDQEAGVFRVKGIHAHAWPEVFIEGAGWVLFEPTPGRGAPGAEAYTGVPEAQETSGGQGETPATTLVPSEGEAQVPPPQAATTTTAPPEEAPGAPGGLARGLSWLLLTAAAVVLFVGLWAATVPIVRRTRRRRRRAAARTAADRVLVAWTEADEALRLAQARRRPSETLVEHARRAGGSVSPDGRRALERLASDATSASYSEVLAAETVPSAVSAAEEVERSVWSQATRGTKIKRILDPRP